MSKYIVFHLKDKAYPENKYWEENPKSNYLGTIQILDKKYDLGVFINSPLKSLVFLENSDFTLYHSFCLSTLQNFQEHCEINEGSILTEILKTSLELAQELKYLSSDLKII